MAGRELDLSVHLLDRQVVDPDGHPVAKVDDVELEVPDDGSPPYVRALLTGPGALGPRLGGRLGRWLVAFSRPPGRIGVELLTDVGSSLKVARTRAELGVQPSEDAVREYLVDRLPGAGHPTQQEVSGAGE